MKRVPYDTKVAACADYLLEVPWSGIELKHGISHQTVTKWIKARGCFKLRREGRSGGTEEKLVPAGVTVSVNYTSLPPSSTLTPMLLSWERDVEIVP